MERLVYSVDEMAGVLDISRPKAFEFVHRAGFPVVRVGRRLLIPRDGLEEWLKQQAKGGEEVSE